MCQDLLRLGRTMVQDGASILRIAGNLLLGKGAATGSLRRYMGDRGQTEGEQVRRIAAGFLALEDQRKARRKPLRVKPAITFGEAQQRLRDLGDEHGNVVDLRKTATG